MDDLWFYVLAGFVAQLIDGSCGMGYGVSLSSLLLGGGMAPKVVSASVHAAECFTTGVSGLCHRIFGNIDTKLFWRLMPLGVVGAVTGAYILTQLPGDTIKPFIAGYLVLMGLLILWRAFRASRPKRVLTWTRPLGFVGAFVDMLGGGGWGPIVASTLVARGQDTRTAIGTVDAAEWFVTVAGSITFLMVIGLDHWQLIAALAAGGVVAAPCAAFVCRVTPHRTRLVLVGLLVCFMAGRAIWQVLS